MEVTQPVQGQQEAKLPFLTKLVLLFTNPAKLFANLKLYPDWLIPIIIIIVCSIGSAWINQDLIKQRQIDKISKWEQVPDEQREAAIQKTEESGIISTTVGITVFTFVIFLFVSLLFWVSGNFVFGGSAKFVSVLSVYTWGSLTFIPEEIIKTILRGVRSTYDVYSSLALLMDPEQSKTVLFKLANAIDIFSIWRLFLWGLGLSIIYNFTRGKSYGIVIFWYVFGVLIWIGLTLLIPWLEMFI